MKQDLKKNPPIMPVPQIKSGNNAGIDSINNRSSE
jgi:hypothetical protein